MPVLVPSCEEQLAIIRFLNHAERLIGRYIGAKQKLIKLLEVQKQAIIHRAVTRGLDPNIHLKPSGVEWLGDIPEGWDARPAKFYLKEVDERSTNGNEELLSVSHKTGVTPRSEKNITMFMAASYIGHKLCCPGDVVVNTMWGWMAAIGVSRKVGIVSPSYGVYRPRRRDDFRSEYLDLLLRTHGYRSEYVRSSRGITTSRLRLYPEQFMRIALLRPPLNEQDVILRAIRSDTDELSKAMSLAEREIAFLREFRTRLIVDAVTGKLDVRAAADILPEVAEEAEPVDEEDATDDSEPDEAVEAEEEVA